MLPHPLLTIFKFYTLYRKGGATPDSDCAGYRISVMRIRLNYYTELFELLYGSWIRKFSIKIQIRKYYLYKSKSGSKERINLNFLLFHVSARLPYTGRPASGFVSLHTDPNPTFIIRIWILGSGSASLPDIRLFCIHL